jgi:hypothetical protein
VNCRFCSEDLIITKVEDDYFSTCVKCNVNYHLSANENIRWFSIKSNCYSVIINVDFQSTQIYCLESKNKLLDIDKIIDFNIKTLNDRVKTLLVFQ